MATSDDAGESSGPKFSLFWGIYGQVAAVLGAFSLLVFTSHFIDVGLKGVIKDAFDWWVFNVRPLVGYPIQWLVQQLPEALRFEVPDIVKDYFAVGVVSSFSMVRSAPSRLGEAFLSLSLLYFFLWPVAVLYGLLFLFVEATRDAPDDDGFFGVVIYLAPLIYLGLILAANTWLV